MKAFVRCALLHPEAVHVAVERAEIGATVGNRQSAEVIPRRDLVAARPQFLARQSIERDELGPARGGNAPRRAAVEAAAKAAGTPFVPRRVLNGLRRVLAGSV